MSRGGEHKRVTLTSIFQGDAGFSRFGSNFLEPDAPPSAGSNNSSKPPTKPAKCIRIKLDLFETDSNKYPEFNYSRLLYLEKVTQLLRFLVANPCLTFVTRRKRPKS